MIIIYFIFSSSQTHTHIICWCWCSSDDDDVTDSQTDITHKTTQNHALLHVQRLQSTIYFDWTMLIKKNNKKYRKKTILCLVLSPVCACSRTDAYVSVFVCAVHESCVRAHHLMYICPDNNISFVFFISYFILLLKIRLLRWYSAQTPSFTGFFCLFLKTKNNLSRVISTSNSSLIKII